MNRTGAIVALALLAVASLAGGALAADAPAVPKFVEETATSGVDSAYTGDWQYMVGGGVATFDCNGDGFPDMLLAGGTSKAKFYRNVSSKGGPLKFVEEQSGLELDQVTGAYPLDIDGDGKTDIVELRVGENVVFRGLGDCKFARANEDWGFDGGDAWSTAFSATWEHGNDWPTLAVGNYIDRTQEIDPWGSCTDNWLHRPVVANGVSQKHWAAPLPLKPSFCALSMLFTDWNRSGTPSLRVSNDREYYVGGQEQMWKLPPGGAPTLYTAAEGWKFLRVWGMGIASYDVNGDGYPDFFLTSMSDSKLQVLTNPKAGPDTPDYSDIAYARGVTAFRPYTGTDLRPSTGWHAQFEDVNNDGLVDLFIAKGNVDQMPDFAQKDPDNLLLQGSDGKFVESGDKAGVADNGVSRGAALTDFNMDGLLDLVVVNRRAPAQLWRNTGTGAPAHWIEFELRQPGANREAIGSWLEVKIGDSVSRREVTVGGGHASGEDGFWHFGLGDAQSALLRVTWPDGTVGDWQPIAADGFYVVSPGQPPQPWAPGQ